MPSFEEDVFNRAQQMHRSRQTAANTPHSRSAPEQKAPAIQSPAPKEAEPEPVNQLPTVHAEAQKSTGITDILFQNKEQNLILLLLILLMEENTEPTLLLALVYLLM